MKKLIKNKENTRVYVVLTLSAIYTMLIFGWNNSPLVERLGEDGSIFLLMGRNLAEGGTLYVDLFDHKGPLIFLVNALPQLFINGPFGVWLLEVVCMIFSAILIYRMAYRILQNKIAMFPAIIYMLLIGMFFNGGNCTEEFCNVFSLLSLSIFLRWMEDKSHLLTSVKIIRLGAMCAITFFFRPNNAAFIGFLLAYMVVYTFIKQKKTSFRYLALALLGIGICTGAIVLYCISQGNLAEMWDATIVHNLKYVEVSMESSTGISNGLTPFYGWLILTNIVIFYGIIRCFLYKNKKYGTFLTGEAVLVLISVLLSGLILEHYIVQEGPVVVLALLLIFRHCTPELRGYLKKIRTVHWWNGVAVAVLLCAGVLCAKGYWNGDIAMYKTSCMEMGSHIPEKEKNSVFGYDVPAAFYYINEITPSYRYFTMQHWMAESDPSIDEKVLAYMEATPPIWLVTYYEYAGNNLPLREFIIKHYEKVEETQAGFLYRYTKGEMK